MRNIYELKIIGQHDCFYSSIEKLCRRIERSIFYQSQKTFHTLVKKEIKTNGKYKNGVFEIIQHYLN